MTKSLENKVTTVEVRVSTQYRTDTFTDIRDPNGNLTRIKDEPGRRVVYEFESGKPVPVSKSVEYRRFGRIKTLIRRYIG